MNGRKPSVRALLPLLGAAALAACVGTTEPGSSIVCWFDFVKVGEITYLGIDLTAGRDIKATDLGDQIGAVAFKLDGNVSDPDYQTKDGDAAFLEPGTPIYRVKGYAASFRVAAKEGDKIYLYEVDHNPGAVRGADLFDLAGKVDSIAVYADAVPAYRLAVIRDPQSVASLVQMVSDAEIKEPEMMGLNRRFVAFHLADGTTTVRPFWPSAGRLGPWTVVPQSFGDAIEAAVNAGLPDLGLRMRAIGRICRA